MFVVDCYECDFKGFCVIVYDFFCFECYVVGIFVENCVVRMVVEKLCYSDVLLEIVGEDVMLFGFGILVFVIEVN